MENRFLNCCFNFQLVGHHFECDRINCKGNHSLEFPVYREQSLGLHCCCFNRQQLGQYWRCIVEDCNFLCQSQRGRCSISSEMSHIFVKLQDVYFFQPNTTCSAYNEEPLQPFCGVFLIGISVRTTTVSILKLQNQFHILVLLQIMQRHVNLQIFF